eukprot:INCI4262.1.p2 GENE.INCI4262.1~~INCI4262.1.p2  ORF type:complete len:158 (-),score=27.53 INCI4262.1:360-833(-)
MSGCMSAVRLVQQGGLSDDVLRTLNFLFADCGSLVVDALSIVDEAQAAATAEAQTAATAALMHAAREPPDTRQQQQPQPQQQLFTGGTSSVAMSPRRPPSSSSLARAKLLRVDFVPSGRSVFRVQGRSRRHTCFRGFCSCERFYHNVLQNSVVVPCK